MGWWQLITCQLIREAVKRAALISSLWVTLPVFSLVVGRSEMWEKPAAERIKHELSQFIVKLVLDHVDLHKWKVHIQSATAESNSALGASTLFLLSLSHQPEKKGFPKFKISVNGVMPLPHRTSLNYPDVRSETANVCLQRDKNDSTLSETAEQFWFTFIRSTSNNHLHYGST